MPRGISLRTRDIPEAVRQACLNYIEIKRLYGICITLTCNNAAMCPSTRCSKCADKNFKAAERHRKRKENG